MSQVTEQHYRAFLLRCWQEAGTDVESHAAWRFMLVEIGEGRRQRGFSDLTKLMAFLRAELCGAPSENSPTDQRNEGDAPPIR